MSEQLQEYTQHYEQAFKAHEATYIIRNPPPPRPGFSLENGGALIAIFVLVIASLLVSASRTIPEFGGGVVGVAAFVMLELGLITYAFIRASTQPESAQTSQRLINFGMIGAFTVMLVANIDSVASGAGIPLPAEVDLAINFFVAISAPVLALISGDVLGNYAVAQKIARNETWAVWHASYAEWREGLNSSWNTAKRGLGVKALEVSKAPELRAENSTPPIPRGIHAEKRAEIPSAGNPRGIVEGHYSSYPDDLYLKGAGNVELAQRLGVGKSILYEVRAEKLAEMKAGG